MSLIRLTVTVVCFFPLAQVGVAQTGGGDEDPLVTKQALARAKANARRTTLKELAHAKLEAARTYFDSRWKEYVAGKTASTFLTGASQRLVDAEQDLFRQDPVARAASLERWWRRAKEMEEVTEAKYQAGQIAITQHLETVYHRLQAELAWAQVRKEPMKKPGQLLGDFQNSAIYEDPLIAGQWVAKTRRLALPVTPPQLAAQLLAVSRRGVQARFKEFVAGKTTIEFLQDWPVRLLKAERSLPLKNNAAVEKWWSTTWEVLRINRAKYEAGSIAVTEYASGQYFYFDAALLLRGSPATKKTDSGLIPGLGDYVTEDETEEWFKELSKARWELTRTQPKTLLIARRLAAATGVEHSMKYLLAGKTTSLYPPAWSTRLLKSVLALTENKEQRLQAYAEHWQRTREVETICQAKYEAGAVAITEYAIAKYYRLDAEWQWTQAKEAGGGN